jgi:hypothetical protein
MRSACRLSIRVTCRVAGAQSVVASSDRNSEGLAARFLPGEAGVRGCQAPGRRPKGAEPLCELLAAFQAGVEQVAERVAEHVEAEDGQ